MTVANGSPYWLQVGGVWKQLLGVAPGVTVSASRPTSTFTTLGNTVYAQVAKTVKRAWGLSFEWEDAEAGRWLDYAATNPGAVYLYDRSLAQINMLSEVQTKGTSATTIAVDSVPMPAFKAATSYTRLVRGGVAYQLSYTTTHTAATTIGTFNAGAGSVNITSPAGTGARRGSTTFIPATDGTVTITWTVADKTSGARLTEGSVDTLGFLEGRNTPCRVLVGDGAPTFKMAWPDRLALADSSYVLTEVG